MLGVLIMAYGGPDRLEDVEPYLLDVRGHRPTAPEIVEEVRERYRKIGGRSPIVEQTTAQAQALQAALVDRGDEFKAFVGMRHWHPYIQDTLAEMQAQGIQRTVGLVMAPHYSRMSVGAYFNRIEQAGSAIQVAPINNWHLLPGYLDALAGRVRDALERFPAADRPNVPVIFSAHSLPERILEWNDPYPEQLRETVQALHQRLGAQPYDFAYQSAAISPDPWLGPDVSVLIERLAEQGQKNVLICPIGFVCEHVEILHDVDLVYRELASSRGMRLERIEMAGTAPEMIDGLAGLIHETASASGWL